MVEKDHRDDRPRINDGRYFGFSMVGVPPEMVEFIESDKANGGWENQKMPLRNPSTDIVPVSSQLPKSDLVISEQGN